MWDREREIVLTAIGALVGLVVILVAASVL